MGLMISSIAKIGNSILPKNMFNANSDYYLYILEYSDFDFQETHNYSSELHSSGMSRILNNYQYNIKDSGFQKLDSLTFHSDTLMSFQNIIDIENLNFEETKPATITPAFLFSTIQPDYLNKISLDNFIDDELIFLKFKPKDRDANRIPQLINDMFSSTGLTVSRCSQSGFSSRYNNVYVFDYSTEIPTTKIADINIFNMGDNIKVDNITNKSGQVNVGNNIKIKTETNTNDGLAKKSYRWQKRDTIIMTIIGVIGLIIAYFSLVK